MIFLLFLLLFPLLFGCFWMCPPNAWWGFAGKSKISSCWIQSSFCIIQSFRLFSRLSIKSQIRFNLKLKGGINLQVKAFFLSSLGTPRMRPFFNWQSIWSLEGNLVIYILFCYRASLFWIRTEKRTTLTASKIEQRRENTALIMHLAPNVPTRYVGLILCVWSLWY